MHIGLLITLQLHNAPRPVPARLRLLLVSAMPPPPLVGKSYCAVISVAVIGIAYPERQSRMHFLQPSSWGSFSQAHDNREAVYAACSKPLIAWRL